MNKLRNTQQEETQKQDDALNINPVITKPTATLEDNDVTAANLFSLENLIGDKNVERLTDFIDEYLPNYHIDTGEVI